MPSAEAVHDNDQQQHLLFNHTSHCAEKFFKRLADTSAAAAEESGCQFTVSSTSSSSSRSTKNSRNNGIKMSQDAEDGPEVLVYEQNDKPWQQHTHAHLYNAARPPMNQDEFDHRFAYSGPDQFRNERDLCTQTRKFFRHYYRPFLSPEAFWHFILGITPILSWLPAYKWRQCLLADAIGGLTVGIMHVPQGIAYALLARLHPVVGLYTSFFPPLFYMLFGTSRHNSIGSFAVVSLMAGMAVEQFSSNDTFFSGGDEDKVDLRLSDPRSPVRVASTLAFTVGILQLMMGLLRLELITTYFSDQVVAGFTTGASMHVFVAQLSDLFGLRAVGLPRRNGAGYLFMKLYDTASNMNRSNPITLALSFTSITFLLIGKEFLNPLLKRRFRLHIPLPFELFIVLIMTIVAQFLHLHSRFGVDIVGKIPTGVPSPILPNLSLVPLLLPDAIGISAVVIAVHISLAKMFAKKMAYRVDPGQELYALGFCASFSSFFPVYPVSCSLGRTLVNVEAGTKTQFSTLFSSLLLGAIILYIGQWLRTLPMCVLSAVIIVALKGMFRKVADLKTLWPLSKIDFAIWLVSFLATVCWDVTEGLAVSIIFALMTTVFRTQWPRWHFLANLSGTNDFRDSERYRTVCTYPGICIFRFDSPLLFTNVDNFKESIHKAFHRWNNGRQQQHPICQETTNCAVVENGTLPLSIQIGAEHPQQQNHHHNSPTSPPTIVVHHGTDDEDEETEQYSKVPKMGDEETEQYSKVPKMGDEETEQYSKVPKMGDEDSNGTSTTALALARDHDAAMPTKQRKRKKRSGDGDEGKKDGAVDADDGMRRMPPPYSEKAPIFFRHFIIDCSGFTFVDCMGVNALKEIFTEMREQRRVLVYFAAAKAPVRDLFENSGFFRYVQKHNFYPTIRDAVAIARKRRNASTQHLLDEPTERQYDAMETAMERQPMS